MIDGCGISCKISLRQMPLDLKLMINQVSISSDNGLVPSGTNHYLSQCSPSSMSPYGTPSLQRVKTYSYICFFIQITISFDKMWIFV